MGSRPIEREEPSIVLTAFNASILTSGSASRLALRRAFKGSRIGHPSQCACRVETDSRVGIAEDIE